jgi:subtilase family serine protease
VATHWVDAVHISSDDQYQAGSDPLSASWTHEGALGATGTYTGTAAFKLPRGASGPWFVLFRTDANGEVYERTNEGNNLRAMPVEIRLHPYPDLQVSYLQVPVQAPAGGSAVIQWTVTNTGIGATTTASWQDRVYVSTDATYQPGTDVLLAAFPHTGTLAPGSAYLDSRSVTLPAGQTGTRYLIMQTDALDGVYEYQSEGNNQRVAACQLTAPAPQLPDLVAVSIQTAKVLVSPDKATANIQWVVRNAGAYPPPPDQSYWNDSFYLSTDEILDSGDLFLATYSHTGGLAPEAEYNRAGQVVFPHGSAGAYRLFLKTDAGDRVTEPNGTNNILSIPVTIDLQPADLVVTTVDAPAAGISGQYLHIRWTVQNGGSGVTEGAEWFDSVYLSRDGIIDETDHLVASRRHQGVLTGGAAYTDSTDAVVPLGVSGSFYVIVRTDRNDDIYEHQAEDNNTARDPQRVDVVLPAPSDLVVTQVTTPPLAQSGDSIEVSWTVGNIGENDAPDRWTDAVFTSADSTWDLGDVRLGEVEHTGGLSPGKAYRAAYAGVLDTELPGLAEGGYRILVRSDSRNNVSEISEANNDGVSVGVLAVDVVELETGAPRVVSTSTGDEQYFHVVVGPEADVRVTMHANGSYDDLQLFVGYGEMPDRIHYAHSLDVAPERQAIVPGGAGVGCYFMVHCDYASGPVTYQIGIESLPFGIATASPSVVGNTGFSAITMDGGQLGTITGVRLKPASGPAVTAWDHRAESSARLDASFDLRGVAPGSYGLEAWTAVGDTARLANGVTVTPGQGSSMILTIDGVNNLRSDTESDYIITLRNQGDADAFDVTASVILAAGARYMLVTTDSVSTERISDGTPILITTHEVRAGQTAQYSLRVWSTHDITMDIVAIDSAPEMVDLSGGKSPTGRGVVFTPLRPTVDAFCAALEGQGFIVDRNLLFRAAVERYVAEAAVRPTAFFLDRLGAVLRGTAGEIMQPPPDPISLQVGVDGAGESFTAFAAEARSDAGFATRRVYIRIVRATDPNEKVGPFGLADGFITVTDNLPYTVYFENIPTASAPAQGVRVYDQLDADYDWRKFRLGELAFSGTVIPVPDDLGYWHTTWPLANGMIVEIDAGIDVTTGLAHWYFNTMDPSTGQPPADAMNGFLPPNDSTGVGQGHVNFRIMADPESAPGTEITNRATIVFDVNEPIVTNTVKCTVRQSWPDLAVAALQVMSSHVPPLEGESVSLTAFVSNGLDVAADSVQVIFTAGDPQQGGFVLGDTLLIPQIAGHGQESVTRVWTPHRVYGDQDIRVLVDPADRIEEEQEGNNDWPAILPVAPRSYRIRLAPDLNLLGLPLLPEGGQTALGLAQLLDADMVIRLDSTGVFVPFLTDEPGSEDFALEPGAGYAVLIAQADTVDLIGATQDGAVRLRRGYNLLSLPVQTDSMRSARDLVERFGCRAAIRHDPARAMFTAYVAGFNTGDGFALRGAESYFVLSDHDTTVVLEGAGWNGVQPAADSLPPLMAGNGVDSSKVSGARTSTPVLAVFGTVRQRGRDGEEPISIPLMAEIANGRNGALVSVRVRPGKGDFAAAFLDFSTGEAARPGDAITVHFRRGDGSLIPEGIERVLTEADVAMRRVRMTGSVVAQVPALTLAEPVRPNPVRKAAIFRYQLARPERVRLQIFSVDGRLRQTIVDAVQPAGYYGVQWDPVHGKSAQSACGVYFARFAAGSCEQRQKLVVVR